LTAIGPLFFLPSKLDNFFFSSLGRRCLFLPLSVFSGFCVVRCRLHPNSMVVLLAVFPPALFLKCLSLNAGFPLRGLIIIRVGYARFPVELVFRRLLALPFSLRVAGGFWPVGRSLLLGMIFRASTCPSFGAIKWLSSCAVKCSSALFAFYPLAHQEYVSRLPFFPAPLSPDRSLDQFVFFFSIAVVSLCTHSQLRVLT